MIDHEYVPFKYEPGTCDTCGKPATDHNPKYLPYAEAAWKMMLKYGGVHSYYGGRDTGKTVELLLHLGIEPKWRAEDDTDWMNDMPMRSDYKRRWGKPVVLGDCSVDIEKSGIPKEDRVQEFAGTFATSDYYITALVGHLRCKCGEYGDRWHGEEVILQGKTIGELIWLAVKEGEIQ